MVLRTWNVRQGLERHQSFHSNDWNLKLATVHKTSQNNPPSKWATSMTYWLFNRTPYNALWNNPPKKSCLQYIPLNTPNKQLVFFIAQIKSSSLLKVQHVPLAVGSKGSQQNAGFLGVGLSGISIAVAGKLPHFQFRKTIHRLIGGSNVQPAMLVFLECSWWFQSVLKNVCQDLLSMLGGRPVQLSDCFLVK